MNFFQKEMFEGSYLSSYPFFIFYCVILMIRE
jgi:hypothetical protein